MSYDLGEKKIEDELEGQEAKHFQMKYNKSRLYRGTRAVIPTNNMNTPKL